MSENERGAGTVLALAIVALTSVLVSWMFVESNADFAKARAGLLADQAALAAAAAAQQQQSGCQAAAQLAHRNKVTVDSCIDQGVGFFQITISVRFSGNDYRAAARAGPSLVD